MNENLLLVDDDPGVRRMLLRLLEDEGYHVIPAATGLEALDLAAAHHPHLTLLDLNLPARSGGDIFERLSSEHPSMPIIIITARSNQLLPAAAAGVGALMEKPLDLPKLLRTIRDLLEEPVSARLRRNAGKPAEFHYLPSRPSESASLQAKPGR